MCESTSDVRAHVEYGDAMGEAVAALVGALTTQAQHAWLTALVSLWVWDVSDHADACIVRAVDAMRPWNASETGSRRAAWNAAVADAAFALTSMLPGADAHRDRDAMRLALACAMGVRTAEVMPY